MNVTKEQAQSILNRLPIGLYLKHSVEVQLTENGSSYIDLIKLVIHISLYQINKAVENYEVENMTEYEIENVIRGLLYHETSHAILTPRRIQYGVLNIFEDERIESVCRNKYEGAHFKRLVKSLCKKDICTPQNARQFYFQIVRLDLGPAELIEEKKNIIKRYAFINPQSKLEDIVEYEDAIRTFYYKCEQIYNMLRQQFEEQRQKEEEQKQKEQQKQEEQSNPFDENNDSNEDNDQDDTDSDDMDDIDDTDTDDTDDADSDDSEDNDEDTNAPQPEDDGSRDSSDMPFDEDETQETEPEQSKPDGEENPDANEDGDTTTEIEEDELEDEDDDIEEDIEGANESFDNALQLLDKYTIKTLMSKLQAIIYCHKAANKANASAINAYSGVFDPRQVIRDDYKYFVQQSRQGNVKRFSKTKLNLFIDDSGSFSENVPFVNRLLEALTLFEKQEPNFEFDVVRCSHGQYVCPKSERRIYGSGGTFLQPTIFEQFKQLQAKDANNYNIVLFDGDAFCTCRSWNKEQYYRDFLAFNTANTYIISDLENEKYIKMYAPKAKSVFSNDYVNLLYQNVITAMNTLLR